MAVNETSLLEQNKEGISNANDKLNVEAAVVTLFASGDAVKNTTIGGVGVFQPFALDAIGGTIRNIRISFYLVADAAATFTVSILKTRPGDLVTFTQDTILTYSIGTPANNLYYTYDLGDLPEGLQAEIQIAQDNNGNATNAVDASLVYER